MADANRQLLDWVLGEAGNRIHGTTREHPLTRFAECERPVLKSLPAVAPEPAAWARVKVAANGHVWFEQGRYSVPYLWIGEKLWLKATSSAVRIFHDHELAASHPRLSRPGERLTVDDHLPPEALAYKRQNPAWCRQEAQKIGVACTKTLDRFDFDFNPGIDQGLIRELATCRFLDEHACVLIVGPCGTGKSHIAQALGHCAVRNGHDVLFSTQSQLLGSLHAARAVGTFERRFQNVARIDLLIID